MVRLVQCRRGQGRREAKVSSPANGLWEFLDRPTLEGARAVANAFGLHAHPLGHGEPEVGNRSAFGMLFVAVGLKQAATASRNHAP